MLSHAQFHTDLKTCPYLGDRPSRLEVRLMTSVRPEEHVALLAAGVRHFGRSYFRPACPGCAQCISIRVSVRELKPSRSQRRVLSRNRDVLVEVGEPQVDDERLGLYQRFHEDRERARGWAPVNMDLEEYVSSFIDNPVATFELRYRLEDRLVAIAYVDDTPTAFNSIFAFWEPACYKRSLGTFDVLTEIRLARVMGKEHLYLGYHVRGCRSLEYKAGFKPCEVLIGGRWVPEEAVGRDGSASET